MNRPSLLFNYDYQNHPWEHRRKYTPPYLLQQACKEFFDVYERGEKLGYEVDVVFNCDPLGGGASPEIFTVGNLTMLWQRVPFEHIDSQYFDYSDWIFVSAPGFLDKYPKEKTSVLMDAADTENYYYIPQPEGFEYDVVFLGNESGEHRRPILDELEKHFKVLRFSGSDTLGLPSAHMLSKGKLALGLYDMWGKGHGIEYRIFLYGNVRPVLVHDIPDLSAVGEKYKHFDTYSNIEELIEKISYYLEHEEEREKMGEEMKKLLKEKHTYRHRAEQVYNTFMTLRSENE